MGIKHTHNSHLSSSYNQPEEDYKQFKAPTIPQQEALSATDLQASEQWSGVCRRSPLPKEAPFSG